MGPRSSQNPAKIDEKSMKDGLPNQSKFCMYFEWPFGGSWDHMAPKSFQNGARWGDDIAPCFRAWKGLGGVLGPLEPQEAPRVDFNRFLIDFLWILAFQN